MRILLVAPPWFAVPPSAYGGTEQVVSMLCEGLVSRGHDVTLLASGDSRTKARLWSVFDSPPSDRLGDFVTELTHVMRGYTHVSEFDVVHDHTTVGTLLAAATTRRPVVHTLHGEWLPVDRELYRLLADRVHFVAISHDQAGRAPGDIPRPSVVHNAVDVESYPFRSTKDDYLAFVGRASPDKGPKTAIEVARRVGRRLVLIMKVNEADEHAYFETAIAPEIQRGGVDFLDTDAALKTDILAGAHAVLVPIAWDEPFGLVMAEANACGTPVVAFDRGAASEVVADGRTGYVVPARDIDRFCEAVERAGSIDPAACREHVRLHFSIDRMVDGYLRVYAGAMGAYGDPVVAAG